MIRICKRLALCLGTVLFGTLAMLAQAQTYPAKPVHIVLPYPPGGSTDAITRMLAQALSDEWKQAVVVENKGGASGMIGVAQVARSDPDGYTLVMSASGPHAVNVSLFPKIAYDPVKDFVSIVHVGTAPLLMVVPNSAPYDTVKEFIAWAQSNRGRVNYCSIGPGSPSHLAGELFASMAKLDMTHIPYKGSGPASIDAIGGTCNVLFDSAPSAGPQVRSGKLKLLAVSTDGRVPSWPGVATVAEAGLPGFSAYSWSALFAPAGTPAEIVQKINADANRILQSPAFREKLEAQGAVAGKGSAADMDAFLKAEIAKWAQLIRDRNIKAD